MTTSTTAIDDPQASSNGWSPAAAILPGDGPPPKVRKRSRWKGLTAIGLIAAAGIAAAVYSGVGRPARLGAGSPRHRAAKTRIPVTFSLRGSLESGKNREVINRVEGQTTILFIAPDGSSVKKGDLVCELDSAPLRDKLTTERITVQQAEADVQSATKTREVAEFALREYEGGTYPQAKQDADIALKMAETNLAQAIQRFDWSGRMFALGFVTKSQTISDRDSKANNEITLGRTKGKIDLLEGFTKRKKIIELTAAVQKARSDELSKSAKFALEESKRKKYETQIERCKLLAPADGLVVHANDAMMRGGSQQELIQEGTSVREGQTLIKIPDFASMRVNAKADESILNRIGPGQRARIKIDALPGVGLAGAVTVVQTMADPSMPPPFDSRLYTTLVAIDQAPTSVRPGMTAQVEILVSETEDVLAVPLKSILQIRGDSYVYVNTPDGMVRRGVRLGGCNEEMIEVVEGLREGEEVSMSPMAMMTESEKQEAFAAIAAGPSDWR
ncbi:efflux RND transporter periplasmic adaptor subunit [Paludisphaera mucosa]|uniref:Efflux RND transporter periplasmic adaptor subunit n=1 Tax=Paludisphaera mucosa TaxID=3030827 RepID=A0ABT6FKC3_9BACT|nr:efflux RND transporter periplasmic adaptor subunit [Paludisphaera mucosa]MDG3008028.1 efflux RND transporter periplasmic adaptor subunit [Paludisphaera mucosa]